MLQPPACQTKATIRSHLSARSMLDQCPDLCHRSLPRSVQDSNLSPKSQGLLRGEVDPWETSPLNNSPLLTGWEKRYFTKYCFPMRISPLMVPKWCLTTAPEVKPRCHRFSFGEPQGHPKSIKKRCEKQVLKKMSPKRPLGLHGGPQGAPGSQMEPKWEQKGSPKL